MKLKEELKKAAKVQAELDKMQLKEDLGDLAANNILCPKYKFNEDLKTYMEIDPPPDSMYKAVGFNDLNRVKTMMEGDDAEIRAGSKRLSKKAAQAMARKTAGTMMRDKDEEAVRKAEEQDRMLDITNLHYRKFYDDELENNKDLFPKMPFISAPIKRGQSRGLKKSWFNVFSTDKVDESGQVSNEKEVGYFKGRIKVSNEAEEKEFKEKKGEKMEQIFDLLRDIHQKVFK